jgi:hypothetical protein
MSLSRLNHRLPGGEAPPEGVQRTAAFHHEIADTLLPQADPVFDEAAALDTAVDMLDPQPTLMQRLVRPVLLPRAFLAAWLLDRHGALHLGERAGQEAQILQSLAPGRERVGGRLSEAQLMHTATMGRTQQQEGEGGIDHQDIFHRVVFVLAALTRRLFTRVLGADDAPFRPVMGKRGESDAATPGAASSASGATTVAASASETPSRWARAVRERVGASPRARSAASNAGKRAWIP